jgi:hypothetical protein
VFLKLFERPLAAGLLQPYRADSKLNQHKRTQLDRLYQKIVDNLGALFGAVGLKAGLKRREQNSRDHLHNGLGRQQRPRIALANKGAPEIRLGVRRL